MAFPARYQDEERWNSTEEEEAEAAELAAEEEAEARRANRAASQDYEHTGWQEAYHFTYDEAPVKPKPESFAVGPITPAPSTPAPKAYAAPPGRKLFKVKDEDDCLVD